VLKGYCAAFLAMSVSGMAQAPQAVPAAPVVSFQERRLHEWPADPAVRTEARIGPDGNFIAVPLPRQDKWVLALNGGIGPKYDAIVQGSIVFSPNGVPLYLARDGKDWLASIYHRAGAKFDFIEKGSFLFGRYGNHFVFVAQRAGKSILVVDGVPGPEWDWIIAEPSGFCHDERTKFTFAYIAGKGTKQQVVVNREVGPEFEAIRRGSLVYSGDDKFFAYIARTGSKWQAVVNGRPGEPFDDFSDSGIVFSMNRLAYAAKTGDKYSVFVDGYQDIGATVDHVGPLICTDYRFAYVVQLGQKKRVVCDRGFGPEVLAVLHNRPYFFRQGRGVLYTARLVTNRWVVFEDGQPGPACDEIETPIFSQDTKRFAYAARRGSGSFVVVDGRENSEYDSLMKGSLSFDSAGGHVLYAAVKNGKAVAVLDQQPGQEYDEIVEAPFFDRFGRGYAYVARKEQERFVVIEGRPAGPTTPSCRDPLSSAPDRGV
jgi:hypothetical protein